MLRLRIGLAVIVFASSADDAAAACRKVMHLTQTYAVCSFDPAASDIRVYHRGRDGLPYAGFENIARDLRQEGQYLEFAMNGGMYESDLTSVGLLVINGVERKPIDRDKGWGNFYLKPNGVFFLRGDRAGVMETEAYVAAEIKPDFATQSGPMLVIEGTLHPAFLPRSDSLQVRNGVGVARDGKAVFAVSLEPVRFHDFATLFRDQLDCANALFLDGSISSLFAPTLNRYDNTHPMGPIIAVTKKEPGAQK
ncbi:phosphodiester glycosidase family protein [Pararhizobium sp. LjRoot255]|uniref:phosphodiester glycosidase family protein n=1 Tax=Pararhizobium sp. LjRoot255 TaxID=3342298 RepID=UPI003ECECF69